MVSVMTVDLQLLSIQYEWVSCEAYLYWWELVELMVLMEVEDVRKEGY